MARKWELYQLEQDMLADVSGSRLMDYAEMASQGIRLSGSVDEKQVFKSSRIS